MFARIREECELEHVESMDEEWQLNLLIGIGWRKKGTYKRDCIRVYS